MGAEADGTPTPPGPEAPPRESFYEQPVWKRFYAFLLGPALVAAVALGIFTIISVLTGDDSSPAQLLEAMRTGGQHRRWQAAFALTKYLQPSVTEAGRESDSSYGKKLDSVRVIVPDLLTVFDQLGAEDHEVRRFLALTFGYLGDVRVLRSLSDNLASDDVELVHYALVGIAQVVDDVRRQPGAPPSTDLHVNPQQLAIQSTIPGVIAASRRDDEGLRATAMYVLGVLDDNAARERLAEGLSDQAPGVRWNAAFGLARAHDGRGEAVIAEILDRGGLYQAAGPDPSHQDDLFLNAVRSAGMVRSPGLTERLVKIAQGDANPKARDLALSLVPQASGSTSR